ncbi:hypothetical protein UPYG_G00021310 [Umbra pygmaea]|uniref:CARD domain-containing protein n=1 Tax=Umbra pygmaea TaxID=75934 RepID=A0ABD0XKT1_UMBPY
MAKECLLKHKTDLTDILSGEASLIFQHIQQNELLTDREYNILHRNPPPNQTQEDSIIKLIDKLRDKGEDHCKLFLEVLHHKEITDTMPRLRELDWTTSQPHVPPNIQTGSKTGNGKKMMTDRCGYIYNVSEIKTGKMKQYFTAVLQEELKCRDVIVFPTQLQELFAKAERNRNPVKLKKVFLQPNQNMWITFSEKSSFSILDRLPFKDNGNHDTVFKDMSLAALKAKEENKENAGSNKVNVTVEVIQKLLLGHRVTRAQKRLNMVEYLVGQIDANVTTLANLTVWGDEHTVEEGKWYRVTNVSVGQYGDQTTLNMTKDSTLVNVPSGGKCMVPPSMVQRETFTGKIIGHWLSQEYTCPQGHPLEGVDTTENMVTCNMCPMTYIKSVVKSIIKGKLSIDSNMGFKEFSVEDSVITTLLGGRCEERNTVEKALVELPTVMVTVLNGNVLSITIQSQEVTTQDSNRSTVSQRI